MFGEYKLIGVCVSKIQEEYRLRCIEALNHHACENGYRLLIFNVCSDQYFMENADEKGEAAVFQLIQYDMLEAMVIFSETLKNEAVRNEIVKNCKAHYIPVISIDLPIDDCINFSFAYSDTFERLCRHIIEDHHVKRVFMMAGMHNNRFSEERVEAFRRVLDDNGISQEECLVGYGDFWSDPTIKTLENWFEIQKLPIPEAIICANDSMAIVVMQYLQKHGYFVPEDCIVTGFDGIMESNFYIPHLTTCTQNYDAFGKKLVDVIEKQCRGEVCESTYVIDFHIVHSQSCGCQKSTDSLQINQITQNVLNCYLQSKNHQDWTCKLQTAVTNMASILELPMVLESHFVFDTLTFAVNENIFQPPNFGFQYQGEHSFSENMHILYQRFFWNKDVPCVIPHEKIAPALETMLTQKKPIIICCLHLLDFVMGYCVFQTEIDEMEYEKMHSFMNAINASLGIYHNQLYMKSINDRLQNANQKLEKLYVQDHMTGLLNRRGFYQQFQKQLKENVGKNLDVVMISVDLDELKHINDTYGHIEGDNAITTVGQALLASSVHGEICSRFGGDEFTVGGIISKTDTTYINAFRQRFYTYLEQYNETSQKPYTVKSSIGFCIESLTLQIDLERMSRIADDHMYQDKSLRKGKNGV